MIPNWILFKILFLNILLYCCMFCCLKVFDRFLVFFARNCVGRRKKFIRAKWNAELVSLTSQVTFALKYHYFLFLCPKNLFFLTFSRLYIELIGNTICPLSPGFVTTGVTYNRGRVCLLLPGKYTLKMTYNM